MSKDFEIYNPTGNDLTLYVAGELRTIKSGETVDGLSRRHKRALKIEIESEDNILAVRYIDNPDEEIKDPTEQKAKEVLEEFEEIMPKEEVKEEDRPATIMEEDAVYDSNDELEDEPEDQEETEEEEDEEKEAPSEDNSLDFAREQVANMTVREFKDFIKDIEDIALLNLYKEAEQIREDRDPRVTISIEVERRIDKILED